MSRRTNRRILEHRDPRRPYDGAAAGETPLWQILNAELLTRDPNEPYTGAPAIDAATDHDPKGQQ